MLVLFALLLLMILTYFILPFLIQPDKGQTSTFEEEAKRFAASPVQEDKVSNDLTPYPFNPNQTTREGFLQLGLTGRQADMILKYLDAGGRFRSVEDFGKMYSISDEEFDVLKPFIIIEEETTIQKVTAPGTGQRSLKPFPFDPNTVDSAEMQLMGLRDPQIRNILNYRKSGGKFTIKKDLEKLYSFSEDDYAALEKYILLPSVDTVPKFLKSQEVSIIVEINTADTTALLQIKGIGPAYARRIVSYRDKLGGFYDKSQLLEVFGMDTSKYVQIAGFIEVDKSRIRKMNLNKTGFKEIVAHPYLEFYIVKSIFEYKETKGKFDSVAELKQISLIYQQLYQKLEHYFTVDEKPSARQ